MLLLLASYRPTLGVRALFQVGAEGIVEFRRGRRAHLRITQEGLHPVPHAGKIHVRQPLAPVQTRENIGGLIGGEGAKGGSGAHTPKAPPILPGESVRGGPCEGPGEAPGGA